MIYAARYLVLASAQHMEDAAVRIVDDCIADLGPADQIKAAYPEDEYQDLGWSVIMPGFVNAHTRLEHSCLGGIIEDVPYASWKGHTLAKSRLMSEQDWKDAATIGVLESLRSGITSVGDTSSEGASLDPMLKLGLHGVVFREVSAAERSEVEPAMQALASDVASWRERAEGSGISIGVAPDSLYATHPEVLSALADFAKDGTLVSVRVAHSREECDFIRYGSSPFALAMDGPEHEAYSGVQSQAFLPMHCSPVRYALNWGILYAPNVVAVHCVHVDAEDIGRLVENKVRVVVCPRADAKLGCGLPPIVDMLEAGLVVGMGTSSAAAADGSDMFSSLNIALLSSRAWIAKTSQVASPTFLKGYQVVRMATLWAAQALGIDDQVGSIEVGKRANLAVVDVSHSRLVPTEHPNAVLAHDCSREDVLMTIIDGKVVWSRQDGFAADVDVERYTARAAEIRSRLRS